MFLSVLIPQISAVQEEVVKAQGRVDVIVVFDGDVLTGRKPDVGAEGRGAPPAPPPPR